MFVRIIPLRPIDVHRSGRKDAEKLLSSLLQNLRVPHVVASSKAVPGSLGGERSAELAVVQGGAEKIGDLAQGKLT